MASKVYTAQDIREVAESMDGGCDADLVIADAYEYGIRVNREKTFDVLKMLRQAADMRERCERLMSHMIPHRHDKEIVMYILRGDAGKEEK